MKLVSLLLLLLLATTAGSGQTFYFSTKRNVIKDHKRKEKQLKKEHGIDLPFPTNCLWLKDSVFIEDSEVLLSSWSIEYAFRNDSTVLKEQTLYFLSKYKVDSIYSSKGQEAYDDLIRHSVSLSTNFLYNDRVERPLVFVDSLKIFNYIQVLNNDINSLIEKKDTSWFWSKFYDKKLRIEYSLPTLDDYLLALKRYKNWTPSVQITSDIDKEIPVTISKYKNYQKGDCIIGLTDNASEIINYQNRLFVVYWVEKERIFLTEFKQPDYHIGFRLKCRLKKKNV